jgi:hypothetical protein
MDTEINPASSSVKIVKFTSGEEVIATVIKSESEITLLNPAKIITYSSSTPEGHVIECIRLVSYLANTDLQSINILLKHVIYLANPADEINKMYESYISFMSGLTDETIAAAIEPSGDGMDAAWNLFSDPQFVDFMQEIYDDHMNEIDHMEQEIEEDFDDLDKEWEKTVNKNKKKKYKKEEFKLPYNPDAKTSDPESWSDNPEDYLK